MSTAEGLKGEKGDKGDQGEQGVAGSNGVDGADGTTYTPEIGTITTVDSTQQAAASVEIDEATARAIFNFSIPKGETGQDGADAPQIDDATAAADTTWSSSKIDDEKLTKKNHIAMTSLGFTVGSTVSVAEFLGALATRFGTHAYINTGWENAKAANVSDGATTIVVGGGLLLFSTNSASFPNASWSWAEAIYFPIDKGNATVYKIMGRTEGTSGTLNFSKIFAYEAKGVANVAPTSVTLAGGVTQVSISGNVDNFYEVVNGICYFQIYLIVREKTTEYFTAISGLPKPKVNVFFSTAPFANGTETMRANVQPSGNLRISHGDVDGMYMLTGSYPVAT